MFFCKPWNSPKTVVEQFQIYDVLKDQWYLEENNQDESKYVSSWSKIPFV